MLTVAQFSVGCLNDAHPPALILPRTEREEPILVGRAGQKRAAVFLSGSYKFRSFQYDTSDRWSGLIFKGITIEMDESTVFDPDFRGAPLGSLVRQDTRLCICAMEEGKFGLDHAKISLIDGIDALPERHSAGFLKWQIVLGKGVEKRVLWAVDVTPRT